MYAYISYVYSRKDPFTTAAGEEAGALEDWNHRIATAYSQLSLGTHHVTASAAGGGTLPPRSAGYSNSSSSGRNNYIGSHGQPDRLPQQSAGTGSPFHPILSNNLHAHIVHSSSSNMPSHHSPSIERLSAGLSSGMEVCSPFKKVKFSMEL